MGIHLVENEKERLDALHALQIVGSERLPEYDAVVEAVAAIFDCPIALISLVDERVQWFKAACGVDIEGTAREVSICQHALSADDLFVVPDTLSDERFCNNPLVMGEPNIRFYAGCPLSLDGKNRLGTLCVIDQRPRKPARQQLDQLRRMGRVVEGLLKSHQANVEKEAALARAEAEHEEAVGKGRLLEEIAAVSGVGGWELCMNSQKLTWTRKTHEIHDVSDDYVPNVETAIDFYAPEARGTITKAVARGIEQGRGWDAELPLVTAKGRQIWVRAVGRPIEKDGETIKLVGAFQDVTERKQVEQAVRESEAAHRTTLETLSEGVLVLTRAGIIQSCNPAGAKLLDSTTERLVGRNVKDLTVAVICDLGVTHQEVNTLELAAKDPLLVCDATAELKHSGKAASRWLRVNARPIAQGGDYALDGVVVSLTDITETKRQANTLQGIFDNFPGGVAHYSDNFQLASYNDEFGKLLGYPADMLRQKLHILDYLKFSAERGDYGPGDPEKLALEKFRLNSPSKAYSYERQNADGRYLEVRYTPLPAGGSIFNFFDVTDRKEMEKTLAESERLARDRLAELEAVLGNMRQGVSVFDKDGKLILWNQQYLDIFRKPYGEVREGVSLIDLLQAEKDRGDFDGDVEEHYKSLYEKLSRGEVVRSKFTHPDGKVIGVVHAPLPDGGWIGTHEDITLREEAAARITHAAHHDDLTGLANRALFTARLQEALLDAQMQGTGGHLLLLDLDRFKPVNDTYGHDVGDELLCQVAQRFKECVRATDLVARIGGDEFAIILQGGGPGEPWVTEIAERLVAALNEPFDVFAHNVSIGISLGISYIGADAASIESLQKKADIALYEVKQNGRNGFRFYEAGRAHKVIRGGAA
ncbi:PAS-domain containing protein [Roseibium sp.]|uniref:PAS-domain containing protein n=1 Tax=Roseibium sp. TaxID=1936156 RepID=UPI003D0A6613